MKMYHKYNSMKGKSFLVKSIKQLIDLIDDEELLKSIYCVVRDYKEFDSILSKKKRNTK